MSILTSTTVPIASGTAGFLSAPDLAIAGARVSATLRLAFARKQHPDLIRAEAEVRLDVAAAIMAMDEAEDVPGRHNLGEQVAVEVALRAYGRALADLVRGEAS